MEYSVTIYRKVEFISKEVWNSFPIISCYQSFEWIRNIEQENEDTTYYIAITDETRKILTLLTCYYIRTYDAIYKSYNIKDILQGRLSEEVIRTHLSIHEQKELNQIVSVLQLRGEEALFPNLLCSIRNGYASLPLYRLNLDRSTKEIINQLILSTLLKLKEKLHCHSISVLYLEKDSPLSTLLTGNQWLPVALETDCWLSFQGKTFQDYLYSFRKKRRESIKREIKKFHQSQLTVHLTSLQESHLSRLAELLCKLEIKHHSQEKNPEKYKKYLSGLQEIPFTNHLFIASRANEIVGFSLFFEFQKTLFARVVGFDYEKLKKDFCYYNLLFYQPLLYAIENSFCNINYGLGSVETKVSRGCKMFPLYGFCFSPFLNCGSEWKKAALLITQARERFYRALVGKYTSIQ